MAPPRPYVCFSGGGIRAGSFVYGACRGLFKTAQWPPAIVSSVSGGGYTATALLSHYYQQSVENNGDVTNHEEIYDEFRKSVEGQDTMKDVNYALRLGGTARGFRILMSAALVNILFVLTVMTGVIELGCLSFIYGDSELMASIDDHPIKQLEWVQIVTGVLVASTVFFLLAYGLTSLLRQTASVSVKVLEQGQMCTTPCTSAKVVAVIEQLLRTAMLMCLGLTVLWLFLLLSLLVMEGYASEVASISSLWVWLVVTIPVGILVVLCTLTSFISREYVGKVGIIVFAYLVLPVWIYALASSFAFDTLVHVAHELGVVTSNDSIEFRHTAPIVMAVFGLCVLVSPASAVWMHDHYRHKLVLAYYKNQKDIPLEKVYNELQGNEDCPRFLVNITSNTKLARNIAVDVVNGKSYVPTQDKDKRPYATQGTGQFWLQTFNVTLGTIMTISAAAVGPGFGDTFSSVYGKALSWIIIFFSAGLGRWLENPLAKKAEEQRGSCERWSYKLCGMLFAALLIASLLSPKIIAYTLTRDDKEKGTYIALGVLIFNLLLLAALGASQWLRDLLARWPVFRPFLQVLTTSNDDAERVYMTDGGHMENLGLFGIMTYLCTKGDDGKYPVASLANKKEAGRNQKGRQFISMDASYDPTYTLSELKECLDLLKRYRFIHSYHFEGGDHLGSATHFSDDEDTSDESDFSDSESFADDGGSSSDDVSSEASSDDVTASSSSASTGDLSSTLSGDSDTSDDGSFDGQSFTSAPSEDIEHDEHDKRPLDGFGVRTEGTTDVDRSELLIRFRVNRRYIKKDKQYVWLRYVKLSTTGTEPDSVQLLSRVDDEFPHTPTAQVYLPTDVFKGYAALGEYLVSK